MEVGRYLTYNLRRKKYTDMSKEIEMLYFMATRMTSERRKSVISGLNEKTKTKMWILLEETGYHKSDYDSEKPFNSNYND